MKLLTTHQVSDLLQVNPGSVVKWVDQGLLRSYRTPGGHRRIARDDLMAFVEEQGMFVPEELKPERSRVLIVDDEEDVVQVLCRLFESEPDLFEVRTAADGIEALIEVGRQEPDLVVLDLFMPNVNGFEVCRRLKREHDRQVAVVAMTGQAEPDTQAKIEACGADAFFEKPLDLEELMACARRLLRIPVTV